MENYNDDKSYYDSFWNMKDRIQYELQSGRWKLNQQDDILISELSHYLFENSNGLVDEWLIENLIREQITGV